MKFDNIYEEEKYFPYMDISLDEAREIRYLIKNTEALKNGKVVCMSLKKEPNYICEFANSASVLKHSISGDANFVVVDDVESLMNNGVGKISR